VNISPELLAKLSPSEVRALRAACDGHKKNTDAIAAEGRKIEAHVAEHEKLCLRRNAVQARWGVPATAAERDVIHREFAGLTAQINKIRAEMSSGHEKVRSLAAELSAHARAIRRHARKGTPGGA